MLIDQLHRSTETAGAPDSIRCLESRRPEQSLHPTEKTVCFTRPLERVLKSTDSRQYRTRILGNQAAVQLLSYVKLSFRGPGTNIAQLVTAVRTPEPMEGPPTFTDEYTGEVLL